MSDIWGRYGPYFIYAYSIVLGLGVALALGAMAVLARRQGLRDWLDGALVAAAGALLIGRAIFVRLNAAYFAENRAESWQLWLGGLNNHGALLGGLAALWLWARFTGRPFSRYAGLFAPGLALLTAFGWAACRLEGCAYGLPATSGPLTADLPDYLGVFAVRYRTQTFACLASLVVFVLAWRASGRARPRLLFWGVLGGLSLIQAVAALGRGDPAPTAGGLRLDLLIDLGLLMVSVIVCAYYYVRRQAG